MDKMKTRYEVLIILLFFVGTVLLIILNQDTSEFANLWIPIYFMIGMLLFFIGKYSGEVETRIKKCGKCRGLYENKRRLKQ